MKYLSTILIAFVIISVTVISDAEEILRIGFTSVVIKENYELNNRLIKYLENKSGMKVKLYYRKTYKEIDDMLENKEIEVGWICGAPYVSNNRRFGLELLVAPHIKGEPGYYSYVIVPINSKIRSLSDLKGKRYAFSDPLSNSGTLVPTYVLAKSGEKPETFFSKYIFTYSHYESIQAVADGFVDGASIDSYIYESAKHFNPEIVSKTNIVGEFGPYGFTPLTIIKDANPGLKIKLQKIFTGMNSDLEGQKILTGYGFESFIVPSDSDYDSIREMMEFIGKN